MKKNYLRLSVALLFTALAPVALAQVVTPEQLQALLKRFPDADTNHDGILTVDEAMAYAAKVRASRPPAAPRASVAPTPTISDAAYGPFARNRLDFWRAPAASAEHPAPVIVYIHGGGFIAGDKTKVREDKIVQQCLDAGVSLAAIDYRYLGPDTPVQEVLRDCARAVQFLRARAGEWRLDPARIAAYGTSGGASASLWLAFHDDLADPKNADPVLRESTRLACAGAISAQCSLDYQRWIDVFGPDVTRRLSGTYNARLLYGLPDDDALSTPEGRKVCADCDMLGLITKNAPPVFLNSARPGGAITDTSHLLHHPRHAQLLYERCRELGVPVVADIPALAIHPPKDGPATLRDFLFARLGVKVAANSPPVYSSSPTP